MLENKCSTYADTVYPDVHAIHCSCVFWEAKSSLFSEAPNIQVIKTINVNSEHDWDNYILKPVERGRLI